MAQGVIDRLTYERLGILLTNSPGFKEEGSIYRNLIRVQGMNYSFTHVSSDIKAIGSDRLITRNYQSPVIRGPEVNCAISYLFAGAINEKSAGFHLSQEYSILKDFINKSSTDDINIIVVTSNKNEHEDLNLLPSEVDFENFNVIGIGNAFLVSYKYNLSVGKLATAELSYSGLNMSFDLYSTESKPKLPSIKLGPENSKSKEEVSLSSFAIDNFYHESETAFDPHTSREVSATAAGDITSSIIKLSGDRGGSVLDSVHAAIQNLDIDVPIPRQDIYGMGSNYAFNKKLKLPIIGNMSIDMVLRELDQDATETFLNESDTYEIIVNQPIKPKSTRGDAGDFFCDGNNYYINIGGNIWRYKKVVVENEYLPYQGSGPFNAPQEKISQNCDFYYVSIDSESRGKIALAETSVSFIGYNIGQKVITKHFVYIKTILGWRRFPLIAIDKKNISNIALFKIANNITFEFNRVQLKAQTYTHTIGSEVMVSSSMSFDISERDGFKIYPRFIPEIPPSWEKPAEVILYLENDTSKVEFDKNIDEGDSKVYYSLQGSQKFEFILNEGLNLYFRNPPDYETKNVYQITILASNEAGVSEKRLRIEIVNVIDTAPVWANELQIIPIDFTTKLSETQSLELVDPFYDYPVEYEFLLDDASLFLIHEDTGIKIKEEIEITQNLYKFDLRVFNTIGSSTQRVEVPVRGFIYFENDYLYFGNYKTRYSIVYRSVSGEFLAEELSTNGEFLYICIDEFEWAKVPLVDSSLTPVYSEVGFKMIESSFCYMVTELGIKRIALTK